MTQVLLGLLFFVTLAAPILGLDLSLAPGLSVKNLFLYGVAAAIVLDAAIKRDRRLELPRVILPLVGLISYAIFTWLVLILLVQFDRYAPLSSLVKLKASFGDYLVVFLLCLYGPTTLESAMSLLRWMTVTMIAGSLLCVIDGFNLPDLGLIVVENDGRLRGLLPHPVESGNLLVFFLPAMAALYATGRGPLRYTAAAGLAASVVTLIMLGSRGPVVGAVVGVLLAAFLLRRHLPSDLILRALPAGVFVLLVSIALASLTDFGNVFRERFLTDTQGSINYVSSGRTEIWSLAFGRMLDYPFTFLTGFGWDFYESSRWIWAAPHSLYVHLLFNLGIIGLGLFLIASANVLGTAIRALAYAPPAAKSFLMATVVGFSSVLVASAFSDVHIVMFYVWGFLGASMRLAISCAGLTRDTGPQERGYRLGSPTVSAASAALKT